MDGVLTEELFSLFSQKRVLRKTADLLDFMLHRALSKTSVNFLCHHNAIPHTLRSQLTCGSFQLYIWRLNLLQTMSFISSLLNRLVLTLTEDIIIQSEPEKQDESQILEEKL